MTDPTSLEQPDTDKTADDSSGETGTGSGGENAE